MARFEPTDRSNSPDTIRKPIPMASAPVNVAALIIPENERKLKNLGTNREKSTNTTNNTATGATMVEFGRKCLTFASRGAEVLIKDFSIRADSRPGGKRKWISPRPPEAYLFTWVRVDFVR